MDRARIRRSPDGWTVQIPAFGFGPPQTRQFTDWKTALRWVDQRIHRNASAGALQERASARPGEIAAISRTSQPYWGW